MAGFLRIFSWLAGICGLVLVILYLGPADFSNIFYSIGIGAALGWLILTMSARLVLVEVTVVPIHVLGFSLSRADVFWIWWMRTFSNQVLPFSGLAYYVLQLRRSSGISWPELAALFSPQFILAATAAGLIGMAATVGNLAYLGDAAGPVFIAYALVTSGSLLAATKAGQLAALLPDALKVRIITLSATVQKLARHPGLVLKLTVLHCIAMLLNGSRLWLLFAAAGVDLDWREALLLIAIAESSMLLPITPGGLGLREGAIVGAAVLVHGSPDIAAGVALVDRLFLVAISTLMAAPALARIHRSRSAA